MQGREKPPAQLAPAEELIQGVDDLPLAALPLEGRDPMGLQEWGEDEGSEDHSPAVIPDCFLEPAALQPDGAQPLEEEALPPVADQP